MKQLLLESSQEKKHAHAGKLEEGSFYSWWRADVCDCDSILRGQKQKHRVGKCSEHFKNGESAFSKTLENYLFIWLSGVSAVAHGICHCGTETALSGCSVRA